MAKLSKNVQRVPRHTCATPCASPAKGEFAEFLQEHVALGGKATDADPAGTARTS